MLLYVFPNTKRDVLIKSAVISFSKFNNDTLIYCPQSNFVNCPSPVLYSIFLLQYQIQTRIAYCIQLSCHSKYAIYKTSCSKQMRKSNLYYKNAVDLSSVPAFCVLSFSQKIVVSKAFPTISKNLPEVLKNEKTLTSWK